MPRLDIRHPGDCLALVQRTFGVVPQESLVVIGLLRGHTGGHMRVDLAPALSDPFSSARLIADCLAGEGSDPAPEAAMVMLIGAGHENRSEVQHQAHAQAQQAAWHECLDAVHLILEAEYCVQIVQSWFVLGEHIRDPRCTDPGRCSGPGLPVEEALAQADTTVLQGRTSPQPQPMTAAAETFLSAAGAGDPRLQERLTGRRGEREPERRPRVGAPGLLMLWDAALQSTAQDSDWLLEHGEHVPDLLEQLRSGFGRDLLIPLATLGLAPTLVGLHAHGHHDGAPTPPRDEPLLQDYEASFLGETGRAPDWGRVDALERLLCGLTPYARGREREHLLCVMAWVEWARGRGTASGSFIDQCLREFPENQFAPLIDRLMQLRGVCPWARVKTHSWSWTRGAARATEPAEEKS